MYKMFVYAFFIAINYNTVRRENPEIFSEIFILYFTDTYFI